MWRVRAQPQRHEEQGRHLKIQAAAQFSPGVLVGKAPAALLTITRSEGICGDNTSLVWSFPCSIWEASGMDFRAIFLRAVREKRDLPQIDEVQHCGWPGHLWRLDFGSEHL